jgi:hypothetical protein
MAVQIVMGEIIGEAGMPTCSAPYIDCKTDPTIGIDGAHVARPCRDRNSSGTGLGLPGGSTGHSGAGSPIAAGSGLGRGASAT